MRKLFCLIPFIAVSLFSEQTPVATLVQQKDSAGLAVSLRAALGSETPLVRATAARVVMVRAMDALLPELF